MVAAYVGVNLIWVIGQKRDGWMKAKKQRNNPKRMNWRVKG